jgi:predicted PurR-regulated permease PerM
MLKWVRSQRPRHLFAAAFALLVVALLYVARRALLPFVLGTALAYILLPLTNFLNSLLPVRYRRKGLLRGLTVLAVYALVLALIVGVLAFVIPPIADQVQFMAQRLPTLAKKVYDAIPSFVQQWLDRYQAVPDNLQAALQRGIESVVQTLVTAIQTGVFKTVSIVFSTLSFVLGLVVVPLWMFFVLRDQPEMRIWFYRYVPPAYREDVANIVELVDQTMSAYLRGRLILGLSMATMTTIALSLLGVDFALVLGTLMGLLEIIPLLGPVLGAIPIFLVTLASAPSQLLWVLLCIVAAQQFIDYVLVPQVARGTVGLHPALVMLAIVVGSEVGGVWGVLLSVPLTAAALNVARYLLLRVSEAPLSPQEARARFNNHPPHARPANQGQSGG